MPSLLLYPFHSCASETSNTTGLDRSEMNSPEETRKDEAPLDSSGVDMGFEGPTESASNFGTHRFVLRLSALRAGRILLEDS